MNSQAKWLPGFAVFAAISVVMWLLMGRSPSPPRPEGLSGVEQAESHVANAFPRAPEDVPPSSRIEPGAGLAIVESGNGRFTVISNGAPRLSVLQRVANAAGLELAVKAPVTGSLSLSIEASPLEQVLPQLLVGIPYALQYGVDPLRHRHVPAVLHVGEFKTSETVAANDDRMNQPPEALTDAPPPNAVSAPVSTTEFIQQERFRALIASRTHGLVAREDKMFSPIAAGSDQLLELLASDQNDEVRTAAAYQLAAAPGDDARKGLLNALHDRSTAVKLRVIESLVESGDPSVLPEMEDALKGITDPKVRTALETAIGDLESSARTGHDSSETVYVRAPLPH